MIREFDDKASGFRNAVALSHLFLRDKVRAGDRVVDATCGNGHDTLFLARLVGPEGKVWGFDIQEDALAKTRALLVENECFSWVELIAAGHEHIADNVTEPLQAIIFNLGYLPGGDKTVITRPESTVHALGQAVQLIRPGGIIVVVLYSGHPGGKEECGAVEQWAALLAAGGFNIWKSCQLNRPATAPYLLLVERSASPLHD